MILYYTNPAAKTQDIRVSAVSDEPLEYGRGYRVVADVGAALLAQNTDHWSEDRPGTESTETEQE